jgi:hypothetical protein
MAIVVDVVDGGTVEVVVVLGVVVGEVVVVGNIEVVVDGGTSVVQT